MRIDGNRRLDGRRIIVTGGASGIGEATAQLFAAHGAKVAILDRNIEAASGIARAIGGVAYETDITDENAVQNRVSQVAEAFGGIDGVVNSAGIVVVRSLEETSIDLWRKHLDVNLTGTFLVCRAAFSWIQKAGGGTIVSIASGQALHPVTIAPAYAASKAGVVALTKAIALEGAPTIRANVVCPGLVDTPMHESHARGSLSAPSVLLENYPLRRWASPREIADANLFLSSSESSYITGATLAVDGGRTFH